MKIYTAEEQLKSAQKTIAVLKSKVIRLYNTSEKSAIHVQLEMAKKRDEENKRKRELMEVRNAELRKYSETLEGEVRTRTEAMRTVLESVRFGFLVVDRTGVIQPEYTRMCETLFHSTQLGGKSLTELMKLSARDAEHFLVCLDQVFDDFLPSEVSLTQMPSRIAFGEAWLKLEGSIVKKGEEITGVLFTVSDITALEKAQKEAAVNRLLISILQKRDSFQDFVVESKEMLTYALAATRENNLTSIRRILHTLKGNAATWDLFELSHLIHHTEEYGEITASDLMKIEFELRRFLKAHYDVIGIAFDTPRDTQIVVKEPQLDNLKKIRDTLQDTHRAPLESWIAELSEKPASQLLGPVREMVEKLSYRFGKSIDFQVTGDDLTVEADRLRGIFQNLSHLIRNAVDHGIELPENRGKKNPKGHLQLFILKDENSYSVVIRDDGKGIDEDALVAKAIKMGLISSEEAKTMNHNQKMQLIFRDGLSSAAETTDISGRGIGMSAVLAAVQEAGGELRVKSEIGVGTEFKIEVPRKVRNVRAVA